MSVSTDFVAFYDRVRMCFLFISMYLNFYNLSQWENGIHLTHFCLTQFPRNVTHALNKGLVYAISNSHDYYKVYGRRNQPGAWKTPQSL